MPGGSAPMEEAGIPAEPWERQDGEPPKAFAAFQAYRDAGARRSLRKAAGESGANIRQVETWSVEWKWVERTAAWDGYLDRERRQAQVDAVRDMQLRHIEMAKRLQDVGMKAVEARIAEAEDAEVPTMQVEAALRYITEGMKMERLAIGEPDTVVDNRHSITDATGSEQDVVVAVLRTPGGAAAAKVLARELGEAVTPKGPTEEQTAAGAA